MKDQVLNRLAAYIASVFEYHFTAELSFMVRLISTCLYYFACLRLTTTLAPSKVYLISTTPYNYRLGCLRSQIRMKKSFVWILVPAPPSLPLLLLPPASS